MQSFWQYLPKLKLYIPFDLTIPLLGIYPTEILTHVRKDIVQDVCNITTNGKKKKIIGNKRTIHP